MRQGRGDDKAGRQGRGKAGQKDKIGQGKHYMRQGRGEDEAGEGKGRAG